jgi:hypothetical protein
MTHSPLWAAAAGALLTLCVAALVYKRRELLTLVRAQRLIASAAITLAVAAVWLTHLAGRRRLPPPPIPVPDRDLTPTPDARPPRPAEVDHAHDLPLDTPPDALAPLVADPDPDLGDLVLRLDARARQRSGPTE